MTEAEAVTFLQNLGYVVRHPHEGKRLLSWHKLADKSKWEIFRHEAVYMIAGQLRPDHIILKQSTLYDGTPVFDAILRTI